MLDRSAAAELWRNTLSQIPSLYGRLAYLAQLRNAVTGRYEHHGLAHRFSDEEAESLLRSSHESVFDEWLGYSLEQQKADLQLHLSQLGEDRAAVVKNWMDTRVYAGLPPAGCGAAERELYLADLETILTLLRRQYGAADPDPDA